MYCPYCAEETLFPLEAGLGMPQLPAGVLVTFLGLVRRGVHRWRGV